MADLEIKDLHVRTEEREILRGVDLSINRGEIHALMGPNASASRRWRTRCWAIPRTR